MLKFIPLPHCSRPKIVLDKPNAFEGSKMMCEEVFFLSVPFGTEHFDAFFWAFSVDLGNYVHILHIWN